MTDRELLELAAKAAGIPNPKVQDMRELGWGEVRYGFSEAVFDDAREEYWNPLQDYGDALRMAAKLKLHILHNDPHEDVLWVSAVLNKTMFHAAEEFLNEEDRAQATRRAIVRAAAEIGAAAKKGAP